MLGLVGGGYWGKNLVREFYNTGKLKIVCDLDEELLNKYSTMYPGILLTNDYDKMLQNEEITMVCVSVPVKLHYTFTLKALEAGKHVYVEKPYTLDILEARRLNAFAQEKGLTIMVGHLLHYHDVVKQIKTILKSSSVGKIKSITCNRKSHGIYRTFENVLWSFAVHDISVILSLCEAKAKDVNMLSCTGHDYITPGIHDIVNIALNVNGIYVNINVDWNCPNKEQCMTIVCEKAIIVFDDVEPVNKLKVVYNYKSESDFGPVANKSEYEIFSYEGKSPLQNECEYFLQCIESNIKPITNGEEAIEVLKVLKMCDKALTVSNSLTSSSYGSDVVSLFSLTDYISDFFVHEDATIESTSIGRGTKVWRWTHIAKSGVVGENCNIGQGCFIAGTLGNGCKVQNNVSIYKGVVAGNNVFFGPSCVLTNDLNPRCEHSKGGQYVETIIEDGATLGANCTIVCGHRIGKYALIGAGAVVTKDVPDYAVIVGNPGKQIGTIDEYGQITKH